MRGTGRHIIVCCWVLCILACLHGPATCEPGPAVTTMSVTEGGTGGGVQFVLTGKGFSKDAFSLDESGDTVGNAVYLVSAELEIHQCVVDSLASKDKTIFATTPLLKQGKYTLSVSVDGTLIEDSAICDACKYQALDELTPTISSISPQSGMPGLVVDLYGRIITDLLPDGGSEATNGLTAQISKVWLGPIEGTLKDEDGNLYGIELDMRRSDDMYGTIRARFQGTSVGFHDAVIIIDENYGRSVSVGDSQRVSYNDYVYNIQTYTDILDVTPKVGSVMGATTITITGNHYDARLPYTEPQVYIGGTTCDVVSTDEVTGTIVCTLAPQPAVTPSLYFGNRGLAVTTWMSNVNPALVSYLHNTSPDTSTTIDETELCDVTLNGRVIMMTGLFKPPHDGDYMFRLSSDNGANLYIDQNLEIDGEATPAETLDSERLTLDSSTRYLMQVVEKSGSRGQSCIHLSVKHFDTTFTPAQTSQADSEMQNITIRSRSEPDVQTLAFNQHVIWQRSQRDLGDPENSNGGAINEVQRVCADGPGDFRLKMFNVSTGPIHPYVTRNTIKNGLRSLPFFTSGDVIDVSMIDDCYHITFRTAIGDLPMLECSAATDKKSDCEVTTLVEGSSDTYIYMTLGDVPSAPINVTAVTSESLYDALEPIFEARCPSFLTHSSGVFTIDAETPDLPFSRAEIVGDDEAFCGHYYLKNPEYLFFETAAIPAFFGEKYPQLCFAYKGPVKSVLVISYRYISNGIERSHYRRQLPIDIVLPEDENTWAYTCINMLELFETYHPQDDPETFKVRNFNIIAQKSWDTIYIDTVHVGAFATTTDIEHINEHRLRPFMAPLPERSIINSIEVVEDETDVFSVSLHPSNCAYDLPIFVVSSTESTGEEVTITRTREATPPASGHISLSFQGHRMPDINIQNSTSRIKMHIESNPAIGRVTVDQDGGCDNFDLKVTFDSLPGDQEMMKIVASDLSAINGAEADIIEDTAGGVWYRPITADMTSIPHSNPQVVVYINDVPSKCETDCGFTWDHTATVTDVQPRSGGAGDVITISGTGFKETITGNTVSIGNNPCSVVIATTGEINCTLGAGASGRHTVTVAITDTGIASGDVEFTVDGTVGSISTDTCSIGGGLEMTIVGRGFAQSAQVFVGNNVCPVVDFDLEKITCTIPSSVTAGTVDVTVVQENSDDMVSPQQFTYDASLSVTVFDWQPRTLSIQGSESIVITTSSVNENSCDVEVYIGPTQATVVRCNPIEDANQTEIEISVGPPLQPGGEIPVTLLLKDQGAAVTESSVLPTVAVVIQIHSVDPDVVSIFGGATITMTGDGLQADIDDVHVDFGDHDCVVESVTNEEIVCTIGDTTREHHVYSNGESLDFMPRHVAIDVGDRVTWTWQPPTELTHFVRGIYQTTSPSSTFLVENGVNAGSSVPSGSFTHKFVTAGTYHIWSGYVNAEETVSYRMVVSVMEKQAFLSKPSVTVLGIAVPIIKAQRRRKSVSLRDECALSLTADCSAPESDSSDGAYFTQCAVPVITSMEPNSGTISTPITITGHGLGSSACSYKIMFGSSPCMVDTQTETSLTCTLDQNIQTPVLEHQELQVTVSDMGNAAIQISNLESRGFVIFPSVESINPMFGSTTGGTDVTVTGYGFAGEMQVDFGHHSCSVLEQTYTEITCRSSPGPEHEAEVMVSLPQGVIPCTDISRCVFTYSAGHTPTFTDVSQTDVTVEPVSISINGTQLQATISVTIGGEPCDVKSTDDNTIDCTMTAIPAGVNAVVIVTPWGIAEGTATLSGLTVVRDIQPATISTHGCYIVITGSGYVQDETDVFVDGQPGSVLELSQTMIQLLAPAHIAGDVTVTVVSNGVESIAALLTYSTEDTPVISSINPESGMPGAELEIEGDHFDGVGGTPEVIIGDTPCEVTWHNHDNATWIKCILGDEAGGHYPISIYIPGRGYANGDFTFDYDLTITDFSPMQGGTGGGQMVDIFGEGFNEDTIITICGDPCSERIVVSSSQLQCETPELPEQACDIAVSSNGLMKVATDQYNFQESLTVVVTGMTPTVGSNGGGTILTITGYNFLDEGEEPITGTDAGTDTDTVRRKRENQSSSLKVNVGHQKCKIQSATDTEIKCETGSHSGSTEDVIVSKAGKGKAKWPPGQSKKFTYRTDFSSSTTWGNSDAPGEGDFVVIPAGQTIYLDQSTDVFRGLLINGGHLIFLQKDLELKTKFILITNGGCLQVGSEEESFEYSATITVSGHHMDKELPLYGSNFIAVREGSLELHGMETTKTWTVLAETAHAGDNTISLQTPVDWQNGSEIVIATTGLRHSQHESETAIVTGISADGTVLTLAEALQHDHLGVTELVDGTDYELEMRAEVGLLSHNVKVRGDPLSVCEDPIINRCPRDFHSGETHVQSCYQGRFGEEPETNQFGVHIIIDSGVAGRTAEAHIAHTEITFAGQAYRTGRHPLHFNLQPELSGSYVKASSIHRTFNRGININGANKLLVEWVVMYNVRGIGMYMVDGTEENNVIQNNLAVFNRDSSSMLNWDQIPGAIWIRHPNNIIRHNAVAGGSHVGFRYQLTQDSQCALLGEFYNNTAHSNGWYGLFVHQNYFPMENGECSLKSVPSNSRPAVFSYFSSWNNEKGVVFANGGALQFRQVKLFNNEIAGMEGQKVMSIQQYTDMGPMLYQSLVMGKTLTQADVPCTVAAIMLPHGGGYQVIETTFVNFAEGDCSVFMWSLIQHTCQDLCGGYTTWVHRLKFINAPNKAKYHWIYEGIIYDIGGDVCEDSDSSSDNDGLSSSENDSDGTSSSENDSDGTSSFENDSDGTSSFENDSDGTSSSENDSDGTSSSENDSDGTSSSENDTDGTSSSENYHDGTSNAGNDTDGTSNAGNDTDGTSSFENYHDGTSNAGNDTDGTSSSGNDTDGTSNAGNGNDDTSDSDSSSDNDGLSSSENDSDGTSSSENDSDGTSSFENDSDGTSSFENDSDGTSSSENDSDGTSSSENDSDGTSSSENDTDGTSSSENYHDGTSNAGNDTDGTSNAGNDTDGTSSFENYHDGTSNAGNDTDGTSSSGNDTDGTSNAGNGNDDTSDSDSSSDNDGLSSSENDSDGTSSSENDSDGTSSFENDSDGTSSFENDSDGTSSSENDSDGTSSSENDSDGTSSSENDTDGTSSSENYHDGTSNAGNDTDGTSNAGNDTDGTSSFENYHDGTSNAGNDTDGTSSSGNDTDGTSNAGNGNDDTSTSSSSSSSASSSSSTCDGAGDGWKIMPTVDILDSDDCEPADQYSVGVTAQRCSWMNSYHRFAMNNVIPYSLNGKMLNFTNLLGSSLGEQRVNRLSHHYGWMAILLGHQTYDMHWINGAHMTGISLYGVISDFHEGDWVILEFYLKEMPDRCTINSKIRENTNTSLWDPETLIHGDWKFEEDRQKLSIIAHHELYQSTRRKRGMTVYSIDRYVNFKCIKCPYKNCESPPDPDDEELATRRPRDFFLWHDDTLWNNTEHDGWITNSGGGYGIPADYDSVMILPDTWVVINDTINVLRKLVIYGVLEVENRDFHFVIDVENIIIIGGRLLVGWPEPERHFIGQFTISLRGNHSSKEFNFVEGVRAGAKSIGVYGGLDLNCKVSNVTWTYLGATASVGDNRITLGRAVDWQRGQEIVITSTTYDAAQTETATISQTWTTGDVTELELNWSLNYTHIYHADTELGIELAAAVGLLSRNCRIVGEKYSNIYKESFGGRVIAARGRDKFLDGKTFTGYFRGYGVEFAFMGQEGYTEHYDPRFSVAFYDTVIKGNRPSSLKSCSFNFGFNTAIGVFGLDDLEINDNVVYRPVGNGIVIAESRNVSMIGNLVVWPVWTGSYNGRYELPNYRWEAGFETMHSNTLLKLKFNLVAGAERIGYHIPGELCDVPEGVDYVDNRAYGCLTGWMAFQNDMNERSADCRRYSHFLAWKNAYYGIYVNTKHSSEFSNNIAVENSLSIFPMVIGPAAVKHDFAEKYVKIERSLFVGRTSSFDCENDVFPSNTNFELSASCRPPSLPSGGMIGAIWPQCTSSGNGAPVWACAAIRSEPTIMCRMDIENVKFANFGSDCRGDVAFSTNVFNEDGQHPTYAHDLEFINTTPAHRVFMHRPSLGKINPAACVDMPCEGQRELLYKDLDGTTMGSVGTFIAESEYKWGDQQWGIGNFRIPMTMFDITDDCWDCNIPLTGRGIVKNEECSTFSTFLGDSNTYWQCEGLDHEMFIIESMDEDYMTRRISPVALSADGYIGLLNGPQDHHYCSGHSCRSRLSTFMAIVAIGKNYTLHFTGTSPAMVRFFILNVDDDDAIRVSMYHSESFRLDVYTDDGDTLIPASNSYYDEEQKFRFNSGSASEFMPKMTDASGANFFEREGYLHVFIKGPQNVIVKRAEVIFVTFNFPLLTIDDFYGDGIIENIALLLNIDKEKIRIVNIIHPGARRRRREAAGISVQFEIGNPPATAVDDVVESPLTETQFVEVAVTIIEECQARNISTSLNVSAVGCETLTADSVTYSLPVPTNLVIVSTTVPGKEMEVFSGQPVLNVLDNNGVVITELGHPDFPWQITASIQAGTGHNDAVLAGTTTVTAVDGTFTFSDLSISHMGDNYTLYFAVTYPANVTFDVTSDPFNVAVRPLGARVITGPIGDSEKDLPFQVSVGLYDVETEEYIADIGWRSHAWSATAALQHESEYASLTGTLTVSFNAVTGQATFDNLIITGTGFHHVKILIQSTPAEFSFMLVQNIKIKSIEQLVMPKERPALVEIEYVGDYDQLLSTAERQSSFMDAWTQYYAFTYPSTVVEDVAVRKGSIIVTFMIDGSTTDVNGTIYRMCDAIYNETVFIFDGEMLTPSPYMTVDGDQYYGVLCGPIIIEETTLRDDMIIGLAVVSVVLVAAIIGLLVWRWWRKTRPGSVGSASSFDIFGSRVQTPKPKAIKGKIQPQMRTVQVQEICNTKYRGSGMLDSASIIYPDSGRLNSARSNASLSSTWSAWSADSVPPPYKQ